MTYPALALPARPSPAPHIIDTLIAERAPKLAGGAAWPVLRPLLYQVLDYRRARRMADAIGPLSGQGALDYLARLMDLCVRVMGAERIPASGRLVAVCNHPTGIADGFAVHRVLSRVRQDLVYYANADALRVAPRFGEVLIPVEWVEAKRTRAGAREALVRTRETLEAEKALIIFPAGRLSRRVPGGRLEDLAWAPSAFSVARKFAAPVLPMHLSGPWSGLFHFFDRFSGELRDMTLFHEFLNKRGGAYRLTVGAPVPPDAMNPDAGEAARAMKAYVETVLPHHPERPFA
jgi:putative hemolysin